MANPLPVRMLLVSDDPGQLREIERLLGSEAGIDLLYADTANAVSRAFSERSIDLVLLHTDEGLGEVLDTVIDCAREAEPPASLFAVLEEANPEILASLARNGVEGLVSSANKRRMRQMLLHQAELLRAEQSARSAEQRLDEIEERYTLLLESSGEATAYLHEGLHIYANPAYLSMFGYEDFEEIESLSMLDLLESEDQGMDLKQVLKLLSRDELPNTPLLAKAWRADGSEFGAVVSFFRARYAGEACVQMLIHEDRPDADPALAKELSRIKQTDQLTGLLNHSAVLDHLRKLLAEREDQTRIAVLLMSVDEHDTLESRVGIGASDQLIAGLGRMFSSAVDDHTVMARFHDHVFALILDEHTEAQADQVSRRIVERCQGHVVVVEDFSLPVTVSVGLTQGSSGDTSARALISQADTALGEALRSGGSAFVRYRPKISAAASDDDLAWEERLIHAIDHDEIQLLSTPISSMEEDDFIIHEIETRLRVQETEEVIMPATFLAAANRLGMTARLDQDQLQRLSDDLKSREFSRDDLWMVTLSLPSISDPAFCDHLQSLMDSKQLPARQMIWALRELEVQERLPQAQQFIHRFGPLGCRFAVCDVSPESATGPILQFLELDFVRLVPEMTQNLVDSGETRERLIEVVREAGKNHVRVIAPKVGDTNDLATLWQLGITLVQGEFVREQA